MEQPKRTGSIPLAGLIVHCPWCGVRMAGANADGKRVCNEHGWFIVSAAYGPYKQDIIKVKTL